MKCSLRIITVDHYMSQPTSGYDPLYSHFRSNVTKEVPVIRVFGVTQSGEKVCAHIHGVFPYICVMMGDKKGLASYLYTMAESLDNAINSSFGGSSKQQHVYNISEISAVPFYGFHSHKQLFLKIEFYRPSVIKRAVQVLQTGTICNQKFQPHEAHISYILQFFIDYNLYGMNFLNLSKVDYRVESNIEMSRETQSLIKTTCCQLEVDATADHIMNKIETANGKSLNPGLSSIREEEERRRMVDGLDQSSLSLSNGRSFQPTKSDLQFRNQFVKAIKDRRRTAGSNSGLSQSSSQGTQPVTLDYEDVSVLKVLLDRLMATDETPDEDSILGSWSPHLGGPVIDEVVEHGDVEEDLSQPFVSFIELSDSEEEVIPRNTVHSHEVHSDSCLDSKWQPLYLDGNADEPVKEEIVTRKKKATAKVQSRRYRPLNVQLFKSPKKNGAKKKKKISSPEIFRALEANSSELRKIRSPKTNKALLELSGNNSSSFTNNKTFILEDSPGYEGRTTRSRSRNQSLKTRNSDPDKLTEIMSIKKVLFEEKHCSKHVLQNESFDPSVVTVGTSSMSTFIVEGSGHLPANRSNEGISMIREHPADNSSDSDHTVLPSDEEPSKVISLNKSSLVDSASGNRAAAINQVDCCYMNDDSDSSCATLGWNDVNATQNSIASFYGDVTLPVSLNCGFRILTPSLEPPSSSEVEGTMTFYNIDKAKPIEPFYSDPCDGSSSKEIGFNVVTLKSRYPPDLEEFAGDFRGELEKFLKCPDTETSQRSVVLQPAMDPPLPDEIALLYEDKLESLESSIIPLTSDEESSGDHIFFQASPKPRNKRLTQVEREKRQSGEVDLATPNNSGQFKLDFQNLQEAHMSSLYRYTTLMVLEVHAGSRGDLCPDPEHDAIQAAFYLIANDAPADSEPPSRQIGAIVISSPANSGVPYDCLLVQVNCEKELLQSLMKLVSHHDPDIIAGYEVEMQSWGYLIQRGYHLGLNLLADLSRVKNKPNPSSAQPLKDSIQNDYDLKLPGRIVLNIWRLMRHEVALLSYSFESVIYHILHTRVPKFSYKTLTQWWNHVSNKYRHLVIKHYLTMVDGTERLLDQLDLIRRTSELASLFGIQFYEVFSRGSQFRVESMMLRLAKRLGFIAVSPSVEQRAHMMAPQSLPLIMEPESRFYGEPVIVLDFQSLYPSMMIAYNYCFSTCLGRLADLVESDEFKFGCTSLKTSLKELLKLQNNIHVSPAGIVFVDKSIRKGVLPQMLEEILETRLMVKASMKRHKDKKLLARALDARQLGLKLIANVTYGYTSANFSGRMPCIEVGDSVVSKGRETLERAIRLVEQTEEWKVRVVYGDTDSMFVLCPGRSREEAFVIGQQIAERVTNDNPPPVKLKLEKVYQPCILQTKKRYAGYMYESSDQDVPVYEAKGIETVRRDGCPAASKILEKSLKLLFDNGDVSIVRQYVRQQLAKVLSGRLSPAELSFAKEYRGLSGYHPAAPVPALKIARELMARDKRAEPRRSERVPYVVICGPPGLPLISLVRHLPSYLSDCSQLVLNAEYYITKAILPPLDRCFSLLGADVFSWYTSLPKKQLIHGQQLKAAGEVRKATIVQYFATVRCVVCSGMTPLGICEFCQAEPQAAIAHLSSNLRCLERKASLLERICQSCCSRSYETDCISLDCPVLFRRVQATHDQMQTSPLRLILDNLINEIT